MKLSDRLLDSPVQTAMDKTNPAMSAPLTPLYNLSPYDAPQYDKVNRWLVDTYQNIWHEWNYNL